MKNNYLALGGLFTCLHALFLLISKLFAGSELLLVLFLPLLSTIYTMKSDNKHLIMFVISTILICSVFDIVGTFIYIIPSLISGILYGVLRKKNVRELELLCITSVGHMTSITFSFFVIVSLFREVKFMEIFSKIFSLSGENLLVVTLLFLFVLGFCEAFLVHLITDNELERFFGRAEKTEKIPKWFVWCAIGSLIVFIIMYLMGIIYNVFAMLLFSVFFIPYIVQGVMNLKYKIITSMLIFIFALIGIFAMNYIDPLNYLMIGMYILSPLVINNFEYNKLKKLLKL